jgi:hypothetical protein
MTRGFLVLAAMAVPMAATARDRVPQPDKAQPKPVSTIPAHPRAIDAPFVRISRTAPRTDVAIRLESKPVAPRYEIIDADNRAIDVTATRGGSYAVSDTLANYRKVSFRRSPISTMLTLKLDGDGDSPVFNVTGGGVSSLLWKVVPGR